ncbi:NAD(P)H dehydrogenase (quinone) [Flagellimonas maritima]|uniref:NAD(P)H dehydrogenase (Quinone) n=1 Tax=Flagellimonas maritima TaxID=1383885 RepID=A0A2Z4LRK1_9FLAO|nr:NAD(P)H-binding protein [Allomuricauda aurantiaca]AWX44402.1 NAD(P)H dehydrogenase (quinone) [Allomuricauda aurantiaca]
MDVYKKTIVVFGCTGTVGKPVLEGLLKADCYVRGVLRSPDRAYPVSPRDNCKLTYVSANLAVAEEIEAACAHADVVFLLTATHPDQVATEIRIIDASKKCGIQRIVKLSAPIVEPLAQVEVARWHRKIEEHLDESALEYCCLRPRAFMQNWERNTHTIRKFGTFYGVMEDARRNYIDARDVADVAVNVLLQEAPLPSSTIALDGPEALSHYEMAQRLSKVTGRTITYKNISRSDYFKMLTKRAKLPQWLATHIIELDELALNIPEPQTHSLAPLLDRKPRIMDAYLQENKALFARQALFKMWS